MKTFKALSALLSYPETELFAALPEIRHALDGENMLPRAEQQAVERFLDALGRLDPLDAQERYVALFDRNRSLSLHLYEHVHGESRDRGQALVRLQELYRLHGLEVDARELPDYLPLFLEFLSLLPRKPAASLLGEAVHVVAALRRKLEERGSEYAAVLAAIETLAAEPAEAAMIDDVATRLKPEADDLAALDREWEEEAVRFSANSNAGAGAGAACGG